MQTKPECVRVVINMGIEAKGEKGEKMGVLLYGILNPYIYIALYSV